MRWRQLTPIVAAAVAALAPLPAAQVERIYSTTAYPPLQRTLTTLSNLVPFALFDVLIVTVAAAWLLALLVDVLIGRRPALVVVGRCLLRTGEVAAWLYLVFLAVWGLNYRREPLTGKLQFDASAISADAALAAAASGVERLNALYGPAHEVGWQPLAVIDSNLASAFDRVQRDLGGTATVVAGRPKVTLLNPYFRRAGVDGMTDPYFLETLIQADMLPFERPFVTAHEWSHLAGFADESEANFVGWLTCLHGSSANQYSGALFLHNELIRTLPGRDRMVLTARLADGPRRDLTAIAARYRRQVSPNVSAVGWRVYDSYLKANRIEAGTASYDEVVRLVLGVRFGPDWQPLFAAPDTQDPR